LKEAADLFLVMLRAAFREQTVMQDSQEFGTAWQLKNDNWKWRNVI